MNSSPRDGVLIQLTHERHIEFQWPLRTTGFAYMEQVTLRQPFMNFLEEAVQDYVTMTWRGPSLSLCKIELLDLISQWTFEQRQDLQISVMRAAITTSGQFPLSVLPQGKRAMLGLPSRIDFAGSTATISHTLEVNFSVLNLSLGKHWRKPPAGSMSKRRKSRSLSHNLGTLGGGNTQTGSQNTPPTSE